MYTGNYDKTFIPPIRNGAFNFIKKLSARFRILIFTSRNLLLASKWICENNLDEYIENVTSIKEPCYLIIDDRCINFNGNYDDIVDKIDKFSVWYK